MSATTVTNELRRAAMQLDQDSSSFDAVHRAANAIGAAAAGDDRLLHELVQSQVEGEARQANGLRALAGLDPQPPSTRTASIEVSAVNLDVLDRVAEIMVQRFPGLWSESQPTRDAVVGFLADQFLTGAGE